MDAVRNGELPDTRRISVEVGDAERIRAADERVAFLRVELQGAGIRTPRPADGDFSDVL